MPDRKQHRGRGAVISPPNRFDRLHYERDGEQAATDNESLETILLRDPSRTIIATNDSPDVGFEASVNPYRGCEHGCVYCFARPTHEYLGFSSGLDFERKILVKENAAVLLRAELAAKSWRPQVIAISGVTDPYQPIERSLRLTRQCLEVLAEFRNPVAIITKNHLVTRDGDLLSKLAKFEAAVVFLSVTTLDASLASVMEPRASAPHLRLQAIEDLTSAGVPTGVMVAPIIPGLTDHEIPSIIAAAASAGASAAGYTVIRLPHALVTMFEEWLSVHFPDRKEKVLNRIRSIRHGGLNSHEWGARLTGEGVFADQIRSMFRVAVRRSGIDRANPRLSTESFRRVGSQAKLFEA